MYYSHRKARRRIKYGVGRIVRDNSVIRASHRLALLLSLYLVLLNILFNFTSFLKIRTIFSGRIGWSGD